MDASRLTTMVNQIATFYETQAGDQGAAAAVADHLRRFWDPRMRAGILAHLAAGGEGLRPAAAAAVGLLRG
jgi:formate dehydrogenase subunit delta